MMRSQVLRLQVERWSCLGKVWVMMYNIEFRPSLSWKDATFRFQQGVSCRVYHGRAR